MTKIAVWKTGHPIADTVAEAFRSDLTTILDLSSPLEVPEAHSDECQTRLISRVYKDFDTHIGYGILRGMGEWFAFVSEVSKLSGIKKAWFNVDNGYFNPGHFNGYYRISYKGTQAKWHEGIPEQDIEFELEDWHSVAANTILICPPTDAVRQFYNIQDWNFNINQIGQDYYVRFKDDPKPIDWLSIKGVITFNSSIGWQALQRGIPVYSDPDHSIIGSYYKAKLQNPIDFLSDEYRAIDREPLFRSMRAHQFTLAEIAQGKAWELIQHYKSS